MTEIEIIKELFMAASAKSEIDVVLSDNTKRTGIIQLFDGEKIFLEGDEIPLSSIIDIDHSSMGETIKDEAAPRTSCETNEGVDYYAYKFMNVRINTLNKGSFEGTVFDYRDGKVVLITATNKIIIKNCDIIDITEIQEEDESVEENSESDEYSVTGFEQAVLDGDKDKVDNYLNNPETLVLEGYSEEETIRMSRSINVPLPWNDDEITRIYNQARRLFSYEKNRGNLALKLFRDYLQIERIPSKLRIKTINTLIDILSHAKDDALNNLYEENKELIIGNKTLCLSIVKAYIGMKKFREAREIIDETGDETEFGDVLFSLSFSELHSGFDFSSLPGVNALDPQVNYREIRNLMNLPEKSSFVQLLSYYTKVGRYESFFALLELFMPNAKNDVRVVEMVGECLKSDGEGLYIKKYLPIFPVLWINKELAIKYLSFCGETDSEDKRICRLIRQCKRSAGYALPNEVENAIIKGNYQLLDVLRGNDGIIISMGYSPEEAEQIKGFDVDTIKYGEKTAFERLILFEGNRNGVAESIVTSDFIRFPQTVGGQLLSLLLDEGNGDLIFELYNYSPYIRKKLSAYKLVYLKALILIGEKEEYWKEIRENWLLLGLDKDMLAFGRDLALEHGHRELADVMSMRVENGSFNDFEMALIGGNVPKVRSLATDADYLLGAGYTSDEIKLIQESIRHRIDFTSSDCNTIANRLYVFQKNKNCAAEFYYKLALEDEPLAAVGLFSILLNENRYQELCELFEKYFIDKPDGVVVSNKEAYLNALYHTGQYEKLVDYWKINGKGLSVNPLFVLIAMINANEDTESLKNVLSLQVTIDKSMIDTVKQFIICISDGIDRYDECKTEIKEYVILIFNNTFAYLSEEDIDAIRSAIINITHDDWTRPAGNGLRALTDDRLDLSDIKIWIQYLFDLYSDKSLRMDIIRNVVLMLGRSDREYLDYIRSTLSKLKELGILVPNELREYLYPKFESEDDKERWINERILLPIRSADESEFDLFCKITDEVDEKKKLYRYLHAISSEKITFADRFFGVAISELSNYAHKGEVCPEDLLYSIENQMEFELLKADEILVLYDAYLINKKYDYAYMADQTLVERFQLTEDQAQKACVLRARLEAKKNLSFFSIVSSKLEADSVDDIEHFTKTWGSYLRISEHDAVSLGEIKDYYSMPEKWSDRALDSLAKHIICNAAYPVYWKLLSIVFAEGSDNIRCNILYHLALLEKTVIEKILLDAARLGLKNQTVEIVKRIVSESSSESFDRCLDSLEYIIDKYAEWFENRNNSFDIVFAIYKNQNLRKDLKTWISAASLAMNVAFDGNIESEFFDLFKGNLETELELVNERFLCGLLLDRIGLNELISNSLAILKQSSNNIPYRQLIISISSDSHTLDLSEEQKDLLNIVRNNKGTTVDEQSLYEYYTRAVSQEKESVAINVLNQIGYYYPELSVIEDVKKYRTVSDGVSDEDVMRIYTSEFEALKVMANTERSEKVILNMIPGEMYLKSRQFETESVIKYGVSIGTNRVADRVRNREDAYKVLDNVFEPEKYPGLSAIFMKCSFIRHWKELITYNLEDESINEIIRSDSTIKNLLYKKSYEVLKSSVLSVLESYSDDSHIIDRADAIIMATGGIKRSKNYLRRIQTMPEEQRTILRKVFNVRIESKTLRVTGIVGSTILDIPGNELVAYLIGMLESRNLAAIFENPSCMHALMKMPADKAVAISEIYATFFYQGIENVFSKYLLVQSRKGFDAEISDNPFVEKEDYCKDSRKRYEFSRRKIDSADQPVPKQLIKTYECNKLEYLYDAIIHDCEGDFTLINPQKMDYLSVVTYLFNKRSVSEIRQYVWKLDTAYLKSIHAMILILLEQYQEAYDAVCQIEGTEWKNSLLQILHRDLYIVSSGEEKNLRCAIQREITIEKKYFLGRFTPINNNQVPDFIERMRGLRAFYDELLDYMGFNGIEKPQNTIDDEKFEQKLERYQYIGKNERKNVVVIDAQEERETVSDILSVEYIETVFKDSEEIEPIPKLKKNPDYSDCVGALKYYAEIKGQSQNPMDILRVRDIVRWMLIKKMDIDGYDREVFNRVLTLVSEKDSLSKSQWEAISGYLLIYFEKIGDIIQLSRIAENDISSLRNIGKISNAQIKFLRTEDIKSWEIIIESLSIIAGVDFTRMSETEQINRLSLCRQKLFINGEKKNSSMFNRINNELLRLLTNYIIKLRHNPELSIDIIGEEEGGMQTLVWENGGARGTLYAVISNIGGDDCQHVTLRSSVNMTRMRKTGIRTIYSGEKIPFSESFDGKDLIDGKVTWNIELSYYDSEKDRNMTITHETKANVQIGGEPLNLGNISTGNPARGKNFVGRKRELTLLRNRYSDIDQLPSMLIRGLKRSGKSSIIIQFADEIKKHNKILVSLVDGQSIGGEIKRAFVDKVLDGIYANCRGNAEYQEILEGRFESFRNEWKEKNNESNWISELDSFYYDLSSIFEKKVLVIIDEMESIFYNHRFESVDQEEMLYAALRALIQKADNNVSFIFCGSDTLLTSCLEQRRESQMFQTLQYVEVGQMSFSDIQEIFRQQSEKYDIEFTKDSVDTIWQYTHGLVWYAKLLGYLVINNIFANDSTIRKEVNRSDIVTAVQMLINGEIGTDKYDLVDASLSAPRAAIVHAMASIMPDYNKELSVDEICTALQLMKMEGYTNPRNGEQIQSVNEKDVQRDIDFLEKMQFVDANASRTKYQFTAELYRLFFREDKRLHLFEEGSV